MILGKENHHFGQSIYVITKSSSITRDCSKTIIILSRILFLKCTFFFVKIYVLRKINKNLNKKISVTRLLLSDWVGLKRRRLLLDEANQFLTRRKKTTLKVFVWHLKIEQLRIRIKLDIQDVPTTLALISCN